MMQFNKLEDEQGRDAAVRALNIIGSPTENAFDDLTRLACTALSAPIAFVSFILNDLQWYKSTHGCDLNETTRDVAFCAHTIRRREVFVVEDARIDPRFRDNPLVTGPPHIVAYAGAPLILPDGYQAGALCVVDHKPRTFTEQERQTLISLSRCVVKEIDLRQQAAVDDLTGLARRGRFLDAATRSLKDDEPAAFALMDLDHFKSVNDTYGHDAGDKLLRALSQLSVSIVGGKGIIGRLGGEEFGILLPNHDRTEAFGVFEALRAEIERTHFPMVPDRPVTASFGMCQKAETSGTGDVEDWIKTADAALYAAKESGRNQVVELAMAIDTPPTYQALPFLDLTATAAAVEP